MGILLLIIVFTIAKNCDNIILCFVFRFGSALLEFEGKFEPHQLDDNNNNNTTTIFIIFLHLFLQLALHFLKEPRSVKRGGKKLYITI